MLHGDPSQPKNSEPLKPFVVLEIPIPGGAVVWSSSIFETVEEAQGEAEARASAGSIAIVLKTEGYFPPTKR